MNLAIRQDMTVDLRTIAEGCGIEYRSAFRLLRKHRFTMEEAFGLVRFEIAPSRARGNGGDGPKYAFLTEDQATFFVTLAQNTDEVVKFKCALVRAFSEAKRQVAGGINWPATTKQIDEWLLREYVRRTAPAHDFGTQAKDGRYRLGYRGPTFTVTAGRIEDAAMVAAARLHLDDSQLMLFDAQ